MSNCVCPYCKYKYAMEDYYYKSDEMYIWCNRCGYNFNRTRKLDKAKSKRIYNQITHRLKTNKIEEAWKIANIKMTTWDNKKNEWVDCVFTKEEKIKELQDLIKNIKDYKFEYYWMQDKEGKAVFNEEENKPEGATFYSANESGGVGSSYKDEKEFKNWVMLNKYKLKKATYTKKIAEKWYEIDALTGKKELFKEEFEGE